MIVREIRGMGLMVGIELREKSGKYLKALMEDHGVLALPAGSNVVRLLPPLIISEEEIEIGVQALAAVLPQGLGARRMRRRRNDDASALTGDQAVELIRGLVAIPSLSRQEAAASRWLVAQMTALGYDRAFVDDAGNAVGEIGAGRCGAGDCAVGTYRHRARRNSRADRGDGRRDRCCMAAAAWMPRDRWRHLWPGLRACRRGVGRGTGRPGRGGRRGGGRGGDQQGRSLYSRAV